MHLKQLVETARSLAPKTIAVAQAADLEVLKAVVAAFKQGIAQFTLIGIEDEIKSLLSQLPCSADNFTFIYAESAVDACKTAVDVVKEGKADALMKGLVSTAELLRAVLNKEAGLRTSKLISHVATFEVPGYDRFLFLTDPAMNIAPELQEKINIIENAVDLAHALGIEQPKVAPICPVEVVNPAMQSTLDAATLSKMNQRGQLKGCTVDGPLALDNAISTKAAEQKGIYSEVAGRADILLVPNIEVGNALYKSLVYFAQAKVGALVVGASVPVILTSRADSDEAKLYSIALAAHYAAHHRKQSVNFT